MKYTIVKYWFKEGIYTRVLPGLIVPHDERLKEYANWHWPDNTLFQHKSRLMDLASVEGTFNQLYKEYKHCYRCPLGDKVNGRVFFRGSLKAPLVFVGEAPGEEEDRFGVPFAGPAGDILDHILKLSGLTWKDYCLVNPILCRPLRPEGGNGKPTVYEVASCIHHLVWMLNIVRPGGVILMGSYARDAFLEKKLEWGTKVNFPVGNVTIPVGITYHPMYYGYQGGIQKCGALIDNAVMLIRQVRKSIEKKHVRADWSKVLDWPIIKAIKSSKWEKFCGEKNP